MAHENSSTWQIKKGKYKGRWYVRTKDGRKISPSGGFATSKSADTWASKRSKQADKFVKGRTKDKKANIRRLSR